MAQTRQTLRNVNDSLDRQKGTAGGDSGVGGYGVRRARGVGETGDRARGH